MRLKGLTAATNYSLADYCINLAEHYRVNEVGLTRFDRSKSAMTLLKLRAPTPLSNTIQPQNEPRFCSQLIAARDPTGLLLRPADLRPEFENWIKGGLKTVGLGLPAAALERARRDTTTAAARGGGGAAGAAGGRDGPAAAAGGARESGAEIAAAAVAKVRRQAAAGGGGAGAASGKKNL